jgi:hypothetical protein
MAFSRFVYGYILKPEIKQNNGDYQVSDLNIQP